MTETKIYLDVPFSEKEFAKKNKCRFDMEKKKWYATSSTNPIIEKYLLTYFEVPYDLKDRAKEVGARWDAEAKSWYSYQGNSELLSILNEIE